MKDIEPILMLIKALPRRERAQLDRRLARTEPRTADPGIDEFLRPTDGARMLCITTRTLRRWEEFGLVHGYRVGRRTVRYRRAELLQLLMPAQGIDRGAPNGHLRRSESPAPGGES